jgi:hypothetical protein
MPSPEKAPPDTSGEVSIPAPEGTASVDDLGLSLSKVSPDPLLDEFKPEPSDSDAPAAGPEIDRAPASSETPAQPGAAPSQASSWSALDLDLDVPPSAGKPAAAGSNSGVSAVVSALNLDPQPAAAPARAAGADRPVPASASGHFAGLDLSAPTASKGESAPARGKEKKPAGDVEDEYEDLPPRGSSLRMALLVSYASAVTIGLIWVLWGHRITRERESVEADPFPPAETTPDPGHRADQSRKLVPPSPLPADRIARLGQAVRLGALEVTPLEITSGPVTLMREINKAEARQAGEGALFLKLRLKNVATDSILVPLDEAFLRERGRGIRDSFIETGPTAQIDMFPLAVVSEWSIVGQEFRELRPDESYETLVVTAPDALAHLAPEMTWRIRLRTDINQTETLGVRFRKEDVRKGTGRPHGAL